MANRNSVTLSTSGSLNQRHTQWWDPSRDGGTTGKKAQRESGQAKLGNVQSESKLWDFTKLGLALGSFLSNWVPWASQQTLQNFNFFKCKMGTKLSDLSCSVFMTLTWSIKCLAHKMFPVNET